MALGRTPASSAAATPIFRPKCESAVIEPKLDVHTYVSDYCFHVEPTCPALPIDQLSSCTCNQAVRSSLWHFLEITDQ